MQTVNFNRACNCRVNQWSRVLRFLPKSLHYILHLAVVDGASTSRTSHLFHGCSVTQGICWTCLKAHLLPSLLSAPGPSSSSPAQKAQSWKSRYLFGRDVLLLDVPGTHGFQSLPCPFPQAQLEEASRMFEGMFILRWSNRGLEPFPSQHLSNDYKVLLQLPVKMILSKMIGNTNMKTEKPLDLG